ncbi:hypothetical protein GCM10011512_24600 [Tersicoccus solisilvae]|uniref:Amidohydrolase-related domain-containing protein n=1 Tax=Tersicoccus solisilvae TaxID=1882339 RepID=A0ABQ1PG71_9MICC|nr:hypothetical protein GCM10011512_24600 [Tersicoccus solisilvae]
METETPVDDPALTPSFEDALPPDFGRFLEGAIDLHVHGQPDLAERAQNRGDDAAVARLARAYGIRGWVLKSHLWPTMDRARSVQQSLGDTDFRVIGSITLNPQVGGVDPTIVEWAADHGAGVVFMPTWGARADVDRWGYISMLLERQTPNFRDWAESHAITVARDGELTPAAEDAVRAAISRDMLVATGHLGLEESLAVARLCQQLGRPAMITHPLHFTDDPGELRVFTDLGGILEFSSAPLINPESHHRVRDVAEAIRLLGPEHVVLSSDVFSRWVPPEPESLRSFTEQLHYLGFTADELRTMLVVNPHRLLGLPVPGAA